RAFTRADDEALSVLTVIRNHSRGPRDGSVVAFLDDMNDPQPEGHMASYIARRKFLATLLGGAVAWPLAARGQQADRKRRIGILMTIAANDPEAQARIVVFAQALQALGWTDGRNARIDVRWSTTRSDTLKYAAELAALPSDVILAEGSEAVGP